MDNARKSDQTEEESYVQSGISAFSSGLWDQALEFLTNAEKARNLARPSDSLDSYRKQIGVILWIKGQRREAANVWYEIVRDLKKGKIAYSDSGGGILPGALLWFASIHPENLRYREKAERFLAKRIKSKDISFWPRPIAHYLLGNISKDNLIQMAESHPQMISYRYQCQAHFYVGAKAFGLDSPKEFKSSMAQAVEIGLKNPMFENEWDLARFEAGKIPQKPLTQ